MKQETIMLKKPKWQVILEKHAGSIKNIKRLTKKERIKIAEEHTPEKSKEMTKWFEDL
jgi:hypothetical protein